MTRKVGDKEKTGVFTGAYAVNPATGRAIPIWIADYVLMEYGTGAIMAVPGHDERDFEFATKFELPIVRVVAAPGDDAHDAARAKPYAETTDAQLVNSGQFDGMPLPKAKRRDRRRGSSARARRRAWCNYRLHDWCISRQRYWGPPIPIIYCDACGAVPVPEKDLPVLLPAHRGLPARRLGRLAARARTRSGIASPVPKCGGPARRETDVSDTFLDSAWYFLRYPSTEFDDVPFDAALTQQVAAGDDVHRRQRARGAAPAVLRASSRWCCTTWATSHFEEPFTEVPRARPDHQGRREDVEERGNVVIPDEYIEQWGADTFRTYLMFLGPVRGGRRLPRRGHRRPAPLPRQGLGPGGQCERRTLMGVRAPPRDRGQVAPDQEEGDRGAGDALSYNTAIAALMEFLNALRASNCAEREIVKDMVVMLAPFAPALRRGVLGAAGQGRERLRRRVADVG